MHPIHPVLAADLVPWWFAAAFWVAFAALVAVVVRDVRRAGGPRAVLRSVQEAIEVKGQADAEPGDPDHSDGDSRDDSGASGGG